MLYQLAVAAYATTCGFVAAGILSSFYTLVTNRPVSFAVELGTLWRGLVDDLVLVRFLVARRGGRPAAVGGFAGEWWRRAELFGGLGRSACVGVHADRVAACVIESLGGFLFLCRIVPGEDPDNLDLRLRVHLADAEREGDSACQGPLVSARRRT